MDSKANQREPCSGRRAKVVSITSHNQFPSSNMAAAGRCTSTPGTTLGLSGVVLKIYQWVDKDCCTPDWGVTWNQEQHFFVAQKSVLLKAYCQLWSLKSTFLFDISRGATPYPPYLGLSRSHPKTPTAATPPSPRCRDRAFVYSSQLPVSVLESTSTFFVSFKPAY